MVENVGQAIDRYERSVRKLNRIMENKHIDNRQLQEVDLAVSSAFDALVEQDLQTAESLIEHVDYLLQLIKARCPHDALLQRLVDRVHKDIVLLQTRRQH